jgi:hypothetical protein
LIARARAQQERERGEVALFLVAALARQDQVVAPVVRGLSTTWRDVIKRHRRLAVPGAAVGAHGPVLREQPLTRRHERIARRGMRRQ